MASWSFSSCDAGLPVEQRLALQPGHGEQPVGRVRGHDLGHMHVGLVAQQVAVERDVPGLAAIVELLAQARGDLGMDLVGADGRVEALADGEHQFQLVEIGFERRGHVGILQLGRDLGAVEQRRAMDLAQRRRERGLLVELAELRLPVRPQLRRHAPAHEGPAHGRRIGLQLRKLLGILRRQGIGDGGDELGSLHQRPFQAAQRRLELRRVLVAVESPAEIALAGQLHRQPADRAADPGVAPEPAAEGVGFVVSHSGFLPNEVGAWRFWPRGGQNAWSAKRTEGS